MPVTTTTTTNAASTTSPTVTTSTIPVVASVPVTPVTQPSAQVFAPSTPVYPSGLVENQVVKGDGTTSIWLLNGGQKWSLSYVWDNWGDPSFTTVGQSVIDSIPTGANTYWSGAKPNQLSFTSTNW